MYVLFFKRILDFLLAFFALLFFFPLLFLLTLIGIWQMKGNPFFTQKRPGKNEKIFTLIKFRTMSCERDSEGNLLPDEQRLVPYGKFLRSSSLDELPELINIFIGDMSIVGPRPLLVRYLQRYTEEQHHRHDVRPGLTGLAQVKGRNAISWEERFRLDVEYIKNVSFMQDLSIVCLTLLKVIKREGISQEGHATMEEFMGTRKEKDELPQGGK